MEYSPFSAPSEPAPAIAARSSGGSLASIIARTEEAVADETAGIGRDPRFDITASNTRKSRCLYELSRALKGLAPAMVDGEAKAGFARLRDTLTLNERAIRAHLEAVGEVAALLQNAIASAQSDGTYGAGEFGWARG